MAKSKSKRRKGNSQIPKNSFKNLVADAVVAKAQPFVKDEVSRLAQHLQFNLQRTLDALFMRLSVVENMCLEEFKISRAEYETKLEDFQDQQAGFEVVDSPIVEGDRVRLTFKQKLKDYDKYSQENNLMIDNCGKEPYTLGPEIEPQLLGMTLNEEKIINFGAADKQYEACIKITRVSRKAGVNKNEDDE